MTQFVGQLKALSLRIGCLSSLNELSSAMEEASKAMMTVSNKIDTKKLNDMAKIMAKEDAKLDMKSEMVINNLNSRCQTYSMVSVNQWIILKSKKKSIKMSYRRLD